MKVTNNRIFVSSTCFDLIDLRIELKDFIEAIGFIPVMSDQLDCEFDTFPDQNSIETCLINLRSCDTVVMVLSQRYGGNLAKAGFGDFSATHLEYLEAKKLNKKILFFVRDRLEADYGHHKKTGIKDMLPWVSEKDIKIFDIIEDRKKLFPTNTDNWGWTFRHSKDIKDRLKVDLRQQINAIRLDKLISTGNIPHLVLSCNVAPIPNSTDLTLNFMASNLGSQSAIEPYFVLYKAKNYAQVHSEKMFEGLGNYEARLIKHLRPGDTQEALIFPVKVSQEEYAEHVLHYVVDIIYKTVQGDTLTDASEVVIRTLLRPKFDVVCKHTTKQYINGTAYEKRIISGK